ISGGTAKSPTLVAKEGQEYPVIRAKQSTLQQLEQSAPEVVAKLNIAVTRLNDLLSDQNRKAVTNVLANLDQTTSTLAKNSAGIDATIKNANATMASLHDASSSLKPTLEHADTTIAKMGKA